MTTEEKMKSRLYPAIMIAIMLAAWACGPKGPTPVKSATVETIGIPVKAVTHVALRVGLNRDRKPQIYSAMAQNAANFILLVIDPETGAFRQIVPEGKDNNYPNKPLMSRTGRLYIGAAYSGHLFYFDPEKDAVIDAGLIHEGSTFPCGLDEDASGRIWIGSYGDADLTSYDPRTGVFKGYGRMDDVDMYNSPMVNADGLISNVIATTRPHIVVLDPKTGEKKTVGPVAVKGKDEFEVRKGPDKRVYIESSLGNFRIVGFKAVPVGKVPERQPAAPQYGIASVSFVDGPDLLFRKLEVKKADGTSRVFDLNWEGAGTEIFVLHQGPDGLLYGSSILPEHLFLYDHASGEMRDFGRCTLSTGEAYSMANLGGKLYIMSYTGAHISVYDPAKPYSFHETGESNPRDLGRIDDVSYRPRSSLAGPLGRLWVASVPDYGMWGGPLSTYDPATDTKKAYYRIAGDASCYTLADLPKLGLIAVGTTIQGGSGTQPKVDQATLFLWDYQAEKKAWEGPFEHPVEALNALATGPDGRLWGTVVSGDKGELFVFDPAAKKFTGRLELPSGKPLDLGLQFGPDGRLYGFTKTCIYKVNPKTMKLETVVTPEKGISVAGPIIGKDIYFADHHLLEMCRLVE
jgi:streptogramin lyase